MTNPRYLTKSRFKLARECPTKLFYTKKKEYPDSKMDDPFLAALAEGGFQVGELAKCYHPGGHDITTLDYEEAEAQTNELLKQDKVIIYEPAIRFNNLFIRVDVLVKNGNHFELIEVKAKSYDPKTDDPFLTKKGAITSSWVPYLEDVAFQKHVLSEKFKGASISSYLMLADKSSECPVDGLNQKFRIVRDASNRTGVKISNTLTETDLQKQILVKVEVDEFIDQIYADPSFKESIKIFADAYTKDLKLITEIGPQCAKCEFKCSEVDEKEGLKSGFKECFKSELNWNEEDFNEPSIFELWDGRRKLKWIADGTLKLKDLTEDDIGLKDDPKAGISRTERQMLQIEKVRDSDDTPYFDKHGLALEFEKFTYPLHFIDFETSMVAIPFNKGRRPYEAIAFQFSHHTVYADGRVEHTGEFLNTNVGEFPNYDFLREFKRQLEGDSGTIFRYSPHENTFLNHIYKQLTEDQSDIPDRAELCDFIKTITDSTKGSVEKWNGARSMVDLWVLVKRYFYDPQTRGSNSIKAVLPAVLNSSQFLQEKYSKPIYGASGGIKSLNFEDWAWLEKDSDGNVIDPYKKLPKMFSDVSSKNLDLLTDEDELNNGGAALTAYGRMQFSEMSDLEREELKNALLRYCELDTMAMVMIFEAWRIWLKE